jgi:very-short-patch-repair endonuclease
MEHIDATLGHIAAGQYGAISLAQLRGVGMTDDQVEWRVRRGTLLPQHREVFAVVGAAATWRQAAMAACLAVGPTAVVSHRAAAVLWALRGFESAAVEVTSLRGGVPRVPGLRLHTTDTLGPADRDVRDGIPVTSVARTLLDLGAVVSRDALDAALNDARLRRLVTPAWMWRTLGRLAVPGRRGVLRLREVLEMTDPSQAPTESVLEDGFLRIVRRYGHPEPLRQVRIAEMRLDFPFFPLPLVAEVDGRKWHVAEADRRRDRRRDNALRAMGIDIVRFGWNDIRYCAQDVDADLTAALATARASSREISVSYTDISRKVLA